jgi:hypothetical protein
VAVPVCIQERISNQMNVPTRKSHAISSQSEGVSSGAMLVVASLNRSGADVEDRVGDCEGYKKGGR